LIVKKSELSEFSNFSPKARVVGSATCSVSTGKFVILN